MLHRSVGVPFAFIPPAGEQAILEDQDSIRAVAVLVLAPVGIENRVPVIIGRRRSAKGLLHLVFQAERFPTESKYQLTLGGFTGVKSMCVGSCGDGVVTGTEKCDKGAAMNTGDYGGCNADCTLAPYCGDGKVNGPEECEPSQPNCGADCKIIHVN